MAETVEARPEHKKGAAWARALLVLAVWFAFELYLPRVGRRYAPLWLQRLISLQTFLMICQVATAAAGVALCLGLLERGRELLGWRRPSGRALASALLIAPLLFAVTAALALRIALPTLMHELATRGPGVSRRNAGAYGRMLQHAPVLATVIWSVVLAAVTEELLFRGLLWSLCERALELVGRRRRRWERLAVEEGERASPRPSPLRSGAAWGATLIAAVVFGGLHHDLPGGLGIVRFVSALCLGVACGVCRQWSGSVLVAMVLHFSNNLIGLGQARHWFSNSLGDIGGVPVILFIVGGAGVLSAVVLAHFTRARGRRSP